MSVRCTASCRGSSPSSRTAVWIARSVPAALVWWASSRARASSAISRSRSRSATSHSSNSGSFTVKPSSRSPRYSSAACSSAWGVPSATRRSKVTTSTSTADGIQGQGLPFDPQRRGVGVGERPAQRDEGVAETTPRLLVALLAPQQGRELVAGVALAGSNAKVGQQGLGLLRRQAHGRARGKPGFEATEQRHSQAGHWRLPSLGGSPL